MSLINKLLQDLEKREAHFEEPPGTVLDGLYSAYDVERQPARRRHFPLLFASLGILVPAVAAMLVLYPGSALHLPLGLADMVQFGPPVNTAGAKEQQEHDKGSSLLASGTVGSKSKDAPGATERPIGRSPQNFSLRLDQALTVGTSAAVPEAGTAGTTEPATASVLLESEPGGLVLRFQLPEKVPYQVYTLESPYRTVFELDNIRIRDDLPDFSSIENIVAVRKHRGENGQTRFVIESSNPYEIGQTRLQQDGNRYALQVRLSTTAALPMASPEPPLAGVKEVASAVTGSNAQSRPATTVVKGDIIKSPRRPAAVSKTDSLLYQGERLYRQGKISEALDRLYAAVDSDPRHRGARTSLALRLGEQQQPDLAVRVLEEGLELVPGVPDWALILAQMHMRAGRLAAAEGTLSASLPPLTGNTDYHALYAAVLQKREKHRMAAEIYRNLLRLDPDRGIWWMGLAISLEAISMSRDARFAYRNALAVKSLTPETQQYIIERIRILEQQLGNEPS